MVVPIPKTAGRFKTLSYYIWTEHRLVSVTFTTDLKYKFILFCLNNSKYKKEMYNSLFTTCVEQF